MPSQTQRPVVVLADPLPSTRELLRDAFRDELGAFVVAVDSGPALLAQVAEVRASLIVLELSAQIGLDLLHRLRGEPGALGVPILAIAAGGPGLSADTARAAGCDECLAKPFDVHDVLSHAGTLLGIRPISEIVDHLSGRPSTG